MAKMTILKCEKCGLSASANSLLEVMRDLSRKGCILSTGHRSWCACGGVDTFKGVDLIDKIIKR